MPENDRNAARTYGLFVGRVDQFRDAPRTSSSVVAPLLLSKAIQSESQLHHRWLPCPMTEIAAHRSHEDDASPGTIATFVALKTSLNPWAAAPRALSGVCGVACSFIFDASFAKDRAARTHSMKLF